MGAGMTCIVALYLIHKSKPDWGSIVAMFAILEASFWADVLIKVLA